MAEILETQADERLAQLLKLTLEGDNQNSSPKTKIQRVPAFLRQNPDFYKYCIPKIISFGPIHHQNENLKQGQHYKIQWTSLYIREYSKQAKKSTSAVAELLHKTIEDKIWELRKLFTAEVVDIYSDRELAWMLFVDGCSLLYYMDNIDIQCPEALKLKIDQLLYTWRDIELLENQLPMKLLQLLSKKAGADLGYLVHNYMSMGQAKRHGETIIELCDRPTHILDFVYSFFINTDTDNDKENGRNVRNQQHGDERNQMTHRSSGAVVWRTFKNIRDLKKAGIRVMANKKDEWKCNNFSFTSGWFSGELRLPVFLINDVTPHFFRNLVAYEMCPDFRNNFECCCCLSFMDSLVDDAEDVKELKVAGVFQNWLGSDEEVATLFNEIGNDLPTKTFSDFYKTDDMPNSKKYIQLSLQIEQHCTNKWRTFFLFLTWHKWSVWLGQLQDTYFHTPWSLLAFLTALLVLILTSVQTWYTIYPNN